MLFGLLRRWRRGGKRPPEDPLGAFDRLIEDLERQGAQLRRAAASLLALQAGLDRRAATLQAEHRALQEREALALRRGDGEAAALLQGDAQVRREELACVDGDGARLAEDVRLLTSAAREAAERLRELQRERSSARARVLSGQLVTRALREHVERVDRILALDGARDEVERAHALAELYREEASEAKAPGQRVR